MNTWVVIGVSTREGDELVFAGLSVPVPANLKLRAGRVELGAALLLAEVESDDLVADEVVAGLDVTGEGDVGWDVKVD